MLQKMAHLFYKSAWLVTGQSKEIISEIQHQVPQARLHHLSNGVDSVEFHPQKRKEAVRQQYLRNGEAGFIYAGLHGLFQGLEQILLAAEKLKEESVRFLFFGDGPEKEALVKRASDLGLSNMNFYSPLSHRDISSIIASMDVAVVPLKKSIRGAVPSKIYEAMASGIPILLVANGEASEIIHRTRAGVAVAPGDIDGLVLSIRYLLSHGENCKEMGRCGRLVAETLFDRARIAEEFEALLLKEDARA
jgi:glycosyltransferase involved in cell wall biosynthesis